jgi:hypothetical protein
MDWLFLYFGALAYVALIVFLIRRDRRIDRCGHNG